MKVLVADVPHRRELEPLPKRVELVAEPDAEVEFVVLGPELARGGAALFERLPNLRVVQSISAGVDSLLPLVPKGVVVCGASGAYDIAVAEWIVATLLALRWRLPGFLELQRRAEWDSNAGNWFTTGPSSVGPVDDLDGVGAGLAEDQQQLGALAVVPGAGARRLGIVATNARRTAFTDSALWNTRATSGSSRTATDPGRTRPANRFGLAFV